MSGGRVITSVLIKSAFWSHDLKLQSKVSEVMYDRAIEEICCKSFVNLFLAFLSAMEHAICLYEIIKTSLIDVIQMQVDTSF